MHLYKSPKIFLNHRKFLGFENYFYMIHLSLKSYVFCFKHLKPSF